MKFRKLRIVWSVGSGIACVLLCMLWVRSYRWSDIIVSNRWDPVIVVSHGHMFYDADYSYPWSRDIQPPYMIRRSDYWYQIQNIWNPDGSGLNINKFRTRVSIWPFVLGTVAATIFPWPWRLKLRFSLRTLLTAATIIAVVLGLIVYATRQ
jgi:hypothetical protein